MKNKLKWILIIVIVYMLSVKGYRDYYIYKVTNIRSSIVESEEFRNPKMKDDTLYKLRSFSENRKLEFTKIVALALLSNDFNLLEFDSKNINLNLFEKMYNRLKNNQFGSEYFIKTKAVLGDIKCFPVICDINKIYTYSYEDTFGSSRSYKGNYLHEGTDIMANTNRSGVYPIVSVSDGIVEKVGWLPKGGYRVGIRSQHGAYFYYAHLTEGSIEVNEGDRVVAGQRIGYMGDTGYGEEGTNGKFPVHLHFGIYISTHNYNELSINPFYFLKYLEKYIIYEKYKM